MNEPVTRLVETDDRDGVWILRICRPPVNALNLELAHALHEVIHQAGADPSCNGIVLTGAPGCFSAGIDTREVPRYDDHQRAAMLKTVNRTILALYALPKPAAAAVSGHALGGAFVVMLACDVRLAASGPFQLGLTEAQAGIPFPAGPLTVVRAELSPAQLRVLALGAAVAGPDSDLFTGIIDAVVDTSVLVEQSIREVRRLASLPAFGRVKQQLRAETIDRLAHIDRYGDEPLLGRWV